jgi:radical SAM protein with 4Fe4S-binding SPASM domain
MAFIENRYLKNLDTFLETGRTPMPCHALRASCFIDPWGVVYPCITYSRPIGRLRDTGMRLEPIWHAAETAQLQGEIWKGDCPQCWTACEAYQSILGNALAVRRRPAPSPMATREQPAR